MTAILWVVLPIIIAIGAALIAVFIMQQRMEVQLARERQSLGEARATLLEQKEALDELEKLREERGSRKDVDDFLKQLRSEQRTFVREQKMLFSERKCLVVQERLFYRNVPLCNWVEHEAVIEEDSDLEALAKALTVFDPETLPGRSRPKEDGPKAEPQADKVPA